MIEFLQKYIERGSFVFYSDGLSFRECNAPNDKSGIYLVYTIKNSLENLVYIGSSGKLMPNGKISIRKGRGGMAGRLIDGRYSYKKRRKES